VRSSSEGLSLTLFDVYLPELTSAEGLDMLPRDTVRGIGCTTESKPERASEIIVVATLAGLRRVKIVLSMIDDCGTGRRGLDLPDQSGSPRCNRLVKTRLIKWIHIKAPISRQAFPGMFLSRFKHRIKHTSHHSRTAGCFWRKRTTVMGEERWKLPRVRPTVIVG